MFEDEDGRLGMDELPDIEEDHPEEVIPEEGFDILARPAFLEGEGTVDLLLRVLFGALIVMTLVTSYLPDLLSTYTYSLVAQETLLFLLIVLVGKKELARVESRSSHAYIAISIAGTFAILVRNYAPGAGGQVGNTEFFLLLLLMGFALYGPAMTKLYLPYAVAGSLVFIDWALSANNPYGIADVIIPPLTEVSLNIAMRIIEPMNMEIMVDPSESTHVLISPPGHQGIRAIVNYSCSGAVSVFVYTIVVSALLVQERMAAWKKVVAVIVGAIMTIYVNGLRIAILFVVAYNEGYDVMELFHRNLGGFLFMAFIGLYWLILFRFVIEKEPATEQAPTE